MGVVCSTSNRLSSPMREDLARAIAKRSDLFGYFPSVGDYRRGGFQLGAACDRDRDLIDRIAEIHSDPSVPLELRRDGALARTE